jgi:hypothetical protein
MFVHDRVNNRPIGSVAVLNGLVRHSHACLGSSLAAASTNDLERFITRRWLASNDPHLISSLRAISNACTSIRATRAPTLAPTNQPYRVGMVPKN